MVKWAPGSDWEPWPALHRKSNHIVVKFLVLVILVGVTFRLLFPRSPEFEAVPESPAAVAAREASAFNLENAEPREGGMHFFFPRKFGPLGLGFSDVRIAGSGN